jgi:hypothetical protein
LVDPTTPTAICLRLGAQDSHAPKAAVASSPSTFRARRPASAMHSHLAMLAAGSTDQS